MQPWQIEKQLRYLLANAKWADAPTAAVLTGGADVSADLEANYLHDQDEASRLPFARVEFDGSEQDPDSPARIEVARFRIHVTQSSAVFTDDDDSLKDADQHGGEAVAGGARASTQPQGKSTGRGLDEVVGRLLEVLNDGALVDSTHAIQGDVVASSPASAVFGAHFVKRILNVSVYNATSRRHYHAVRGLTATPGAGQVALTWKLPPDRYDLLSIVVRHAAGATAPATPSSGTGVTLSGALATSVTISGLSAGARSVSVFAVYDETRSPPSVEERDSDPVSATVTVT